jgi:hypothetical protein
MCAELRERLGNPADGISDPSGDGLAGAFGCGSTQEAGTPFGPHGPAQVGEELFALVDGAFLRGQVGSAAGFVELPV